MGLGDDGRKVIAKASTKMLSAFAGYKVDIAVQQKLEVFVAAPQVVTLPRLGGVLAASFGGASMLRDCCAESLFEFGSWYGCWKKTQIPTKHSQHEFEAHVRACVAGAEEARRSGSRTWFT